MKETRSTCPYCGVGCGVVIESHGGQITGVRGDPEHPANFGKLCSKGSTLHLTATAAVTRQARLLHPMRRAQRGATAQRIGWDEALDEAAGTLARIAQDHGPDALGFYISGQLLTEDYYVFNKLAKGLLQTNNVDTNSRLCMSSAVAGYKATLGADAPPCSYEDIDHAGSLFISGSNAAWAHPILFRRIEAARAARPALKIVVVDPRRTETAELADLHLALQPGTDVLLCHGLLHIMLWEGWTDPGYIAAHTQGFDALKALVRDATPEKVAATCGLAKDDLLMAARWFALGGATGAGDRGPTLSLYCQGLNQSTSGTAKNAALINLHLACGQIGKPGAGPFSLTGQPNAMGGREVGGMANLLSAHRDLANPVHRAEVAALWGLPGVPERPGLTAVDMFQAAADGQIKALWIACTNPAQSLPDQATVRRALQRCELVVVQEAFATTATCAYADLLLPATTWGEKDGTVTNSERRISRVRPAVAPPGQARHDWAIAVDLARRLERLLRPGAATLFPYPSAEAIWNEHRESTRGRDLDITGMDYAQLDRRPLQWPMPEGAAGGRTRLYEDGVFPTPDGRARFDATPFCPVAEPREARYPFALTTGRLRDQWHGASRTGTLGRLFGHAGEPAVELNAGDMARRALPEGGLVHVTSRRGSIVLPARASSAVAPGQAFIAMHWGGELLGGRSAQGEPLAGVNALTQSAFCQRSKQPELKHAAVKVLKADLPWQLVAAAWLPEAEVLAAQQALRPWMAQFDYATCVPFGDASGHHGLLFRAAAAEPTPARTLTVLEERLGLATGPMLRYSDCRRGQQRTLRIEWQGAVTVLTAFLLAGDTTAQQWMLALLKDRRPAQGFGRAMLSPAALAPATTQAAASPQICTCFNVSQAAIDTCLSTLQGDAPARLAGLQAQLACGTNCGSCLPALRRRVREVPAPVVSA